MRKLTFKTQKLVFMVILLIFTIASSSCKSEKVRDHMQFKVNPGEEIVVLETSAGIMKIKLLDKAAPIQVENFKSKVKSGELIGMEFNYKLPNRTATAYPSKDGMRDYKVLIRDKVDPNYYLFQGALFIPRYAENGNVAFDGLSFGIVTNHSLTKNDAKALNPNLDDVTINLLVKYNGEAKSQGRLVIFGQVIEGFNVVEELNKESGIIVITGTRLEIIK